MNAITNSPQSKWLLFKAGAPLVSSSLSTPLQLAYLSTKDVRPFLGSEPFFGQGQKAGSLADDVAKSESTRHLGPRVVFLGLTQHPSDTALPSSDFADPEAAVENIKGTPYFSLDVAEIQEASTAETAFQHTDLAQAGHSFQWMDSRKVMTRLDIFNGSIFAVARSMVDWNHRNKVRSGCHFYLRTLSHIYPSSVLAVALPRCLSGLAGRFHATLCCRGMGRVTVPLEKASTSRL